MKGRAVGIAVAVIVLLAGAGAYVWAPRDAPEIAELKEMAVKPPSEALNNQVREVIQKQVQAIPDSQRQQYFESAAPILIPMFARQFEAQYDAFMKMTPEEQRKELDRKIDEMEARRGRRVNGQAGGEGTNDGPPRPGRGTMDPKRADEFQKKMLAYTTPDQRSKWQNGMQMFNKRRVERGLEPVEMGRR